MEVTSLVFLARLLIPLRSVHAVLLAIPLITFVSSGSVTAEVVIQLTPGEEPCVEVVGLSAETLAALSREQRDRHHWVRVFALYVMNDGAPSATPVLGDYKVVAGRLQFTPRFPLRPGLSYRAVFDRAAISRAPLRGKSSPGPSPGPREGSRERVEADLALPAAPPVPQTVVQAVYPSINVLPENLLKFYIHFSAPMQRGDIYRHIRLLTGTGESVDLPFLELAEELWDRSGTRLTLLLDPGRVKQELKPHEEVGRALAKGHDYILAISAGWLDAHGNPLANEFRKPFRVAAPDVQQPDPQRWRLTAPSVGTRQPLVLTFQEPLDQAMLQHVIQVVGPADDFLDGHITVGKHEMQWSFRPAKPWRRGSYRLIVDGTLEDLAGNSIERPFEVLLPAGRQAEVKQYTLPFHIARPPKETASPQD